jgi:hypothetical protein
MYRTVVIVLVCAALANCAREQVQHQSGAVNHATAVSMSEQVLLNAVRASYDMPMSFTALRSYTAQNMLSGGAQVTVPFGPKLSSTSSNTFQPSVNWHPGVSSIQYTDVNTGTYIRSLNNPLTGDDLDRYVSEGTFSIVVFTIFMREFSLHSELRRAILWEQQEHCRRLPANPLCREIAEIEANCPRWWNQPPQPFQKGHQYLTLANTGVDKCTYLVFQSFLHALQITGFSADLVSLPSDQEARPAKSGQGTATSKNKPTDSSKADKKSAGGDSTDAAQQRNTKVFLFSFGSPLVQRKYEQISRALKAQRVQRDAIQIELRSPRSLLTFLGNMVALQNHSSDPFVPEVLFGSAGKFPIFRAIQGVPIGPDAALIVVDDYGRPFYVPHPEYGQWARDQTLRVLSIAGEVVNQAISEKDFISAPILIRPIQ